ncbi:MAG: UDP-N-acetylmuramoyl-L-alanyl-D-glutamate--2,6-diaminopimelate ligase, partial [Victivallales bacterium]|nr:UDP-N-acetylmuramoyl-L-alanyl-D-glutamate--2,6-diaminopimelate ligase [Victivallales bacterium]
LEIDINGACSDSRAVCPGYLFCAMKGAKQDGHDYIESAIANGASAILAEHPIALPNNIPCIVIRNPYQVFGMVAETIANKPAASFRLIAVTGTNGKTTTAYLMREILKACGKSTGMIGTVEYDLGNGTKIAADRTTPTPFALQDLFTAIKDNAAEYAVIEASSHALEQGRLGTAKCDVAIFTNLTQDHLDYHINMENYFSAKMLLFSRHLADGGTAVINADDAYGARIAAELAGGHVLAYSFSDAPQANVRIHGLSLSANGSSFQMSFPDGNEWDVTTILPGAYNAANVAGALCAAYAIGLSKEAVLSAIAKSHGAPGRMQPVSVPGQDFAVYVDYAHTDDALRNVLSALRSLPHNRLVAVFGCGGDRDRTKRPLMGKAAAELADILYVTSDNPRTENPDDIIREILNGIPYNAAYQAITDRKQAIFDAISNAQKGDIILIAGKGHEDYQEINGVKHHFNDCETALEALNGPQVSLRSSWGF